MSTHAEQNYKGVWDSRIGFGEKSALIVIDFVQGYTREDAPLYAPGVVTAVAESIELIASARQHGVPVIHTRVLYTAPDFIDGGVWIKKAPVLKGLTEGSVYAEFHPDVLPIAGEVIITKQYASAFFGTSLVATLNGLRADTLIIAGCTTSGCIRATAVDAVQHGFRTIVVGECVGDRHAAPHEANLFDINAKYGDVVSKAETLTYFASLKK
jgi:maleamate amidohydrolase